MWQESGSVKPLALKVYYSWYAVWPRELNDVKLSNKNIRSVGCHFSCESFVKYSRHLIPHQVVDCIMWVNITCLYILTYLLTCLLHGAESFLRSQLVCSQSRNSPHFMEPEGSLPHSQASATCPYPWPTQSSSHTHIPPPGDPS